MASCLAPAAFAVPASSPNFSSMMMATGPGTGEIQNLGRSHLPARSDSYIARAEIRIDADGNTTKVKLLNSSGSKQWDAELERQLGQIRYAALKDEAAPIALTFKVAFRVNLPN
jgi:TonB-like protein